MEHALIIFIKNPVLGKVKTRIASHAGEAAALDIYKNLLDHTRIVVGSIEATRLLFYSDRVQRFALGTMGQSLEKRLRYHN